jgi:predicted DNA-binding transcriptional regulator YafY
LHAEPVDADWDELEIPFGHGLAADLTEFGADVLVVGPAELRSDVIARLRAVAGSAAGTDTAVATSGGSAQ